MIGGGYPLVVMGTTSKIQKVSTHEVVRKVLLINSYGVRTTSTSLEVLVGLAHLDVKHLCRKMM
jgi:hypothetical protein